jgi:pimeloyl-ACP methyl ester carboxylesterase
MPDLPVHRFPGLDGVELAWREVGSGRPFVLLHGLMGSGALLAGQGLVPALARPWRPPGPCGRGGAGPRCARCRERPVRRAPLKCQPSAILRLTAEHSPGNAYPGNVAAYINGVFRGTIAATDRMPAGLHLYLP